MTSQVPTFGDTPPDYGPQIAWLKVFFFLVVAALALRLWYLQIINGEEYRLKSERNHTSLLDIPTQRGLILDRHGQVLVDNQISYDLFVTPGEVERPEELAQQVGRLIGRDPQELSKRLAGLAKKQKFNSQMWVTGLTRADLVTLQTRHYELPGVTIQINSVRQPTMDNFAPHLIGYLGEISPKQLSEEPYLGLKQGALVGQSGIEQSQEALLHGKKGQRLTTVDSHGRILEELRAEYPEPGHNIRLTINSRLQRVAQALLGERAGAIVVLDPRNFEILAMASSPTFNLRDFVGGVSAERWKSLTEDPFRPMENRAVGGQYPPGSTFKIAMALTALREGVITPESVFHCGGALFLGGSRFGCWARAGHGAVNLHRSLKESCDVYYYEVGRRLGVDRLANGVRRYFGLGRTLDVDLQTERSGLVPDQAWKLRRFGKPWNFGETLPVSIGQGYLLTTPLQVAQYTAVAANGGTLYRPHLVKEVTDFEGHLIKRVEPEIISQLDLRPDYTQAVRRALDAVVNEAGGTGRRGQIPGVQVAGKTGTSQVISLDRYQLYSRGGVLPWKYREHAWFTAYAPADNPEVVVTVLLEHAGGGGANSAPLAAKLLAAYFDASVDTNVMPPYQAQPDKPTGWRGDL
ncbi:MAG: penicillin-binding protein 2 [Deltaproteobacteria bacterium]|jgi:penicillin-binding protein 2|nr:penicillin-binding protein 2 [Deltaproteobacteria bacterium]